MYLFFLAFVVSSGIVSAISCMDKEKTEKQDADFPEAYEFEIIEIHDRQYD